MLKVGDHGMIRNTQTPCDGKMGTVTEVQDWDLPEHVYHVQTWDGPTCSILEKNFLRCEILPPRDVAFRKE